jgi:hypothetical protein
VLNVFTLHIFIFSTVIYTRITLGYHFLIIALQIHNLLKKFILLQDIYEKTVFLEHE